MIANPRCPESALFLLDVNGVSVRQEDAIIHGEHERTLS